MFLINNEMSMSWLLLIMTFVAFSNKEEQEGSGAIFVSGRKVVSFLGKL